MALTGGPALAIDDVDMHGMLSAAERQLEVEEFQAAEKMAADVIRQIEQRGDRYDPGLVQPLTLRGEALHGMGSYHEAIETFNRALHVNRISSGLHTPDQVDIVYKEAESWIALGDVRRANDLQQYAFEVLHRAYGSESPDLVPGLFRIAEWNLRTFSVFTARQYYEEAVRILTRANGADDPHLIPALAGLANSYRLERLPPASTMEPSGPTFTISTGPVMPRPAAMDERRRLVNRYADGEKALRQILKIREANPDTATEELVGAYLDLADWNLIFERFRDADTLYRYARQLWLERGGDTEVVEAHFGQPVPIYLPLPPATRQSRTAPEQIVRTGFVELQYSVNERGRTYDVRAVESNPPDVLEARTVRGMRAGIFRPRLTASGPVDARGLVHRHSFNYIPDSQRAPEDEESDAERSSAPHRQAMHEDEILLPPDRGRGPG
jgi:tetratricopeptide (TPR) repeat protein